MEEQLGRVIINNQTRAQDINKNWGKKKPSLLARAYV